MMKGAETPRSVYCQTPIAWGKLLAAEANGAAVREEEDTPSRDVAARSI